MRLVYNNRVYHMVYLTDAVLKDGIYVSEGLCEDGNLISLIGRTKILIWSILVQFL